MKKMLKNKDGITLISLVVTIIILLILAGISIGMLSGDNGILGQAGNAKNQTDIAGEKEIIDLAVVHAMGKSKYGDIDETYFTSELEKNNATVTKSGSKYKVTFTSGRQYEVDQDGNVEQLPEATGIASLTAERKIINIGYKTQLIPTFEPENSAGTVTYSSLDETIATVNSFGEVTGVKEGTATITAKVKGKEQTITITVQKLLVASEVFETSGMTEGKMHVGDYVNYPVNYTNVAGWIQSNNIENYFPEDKYVGWRVMSIEESGDNQYIKLVSTGVPLNYYHYDDEDRSIANLTTGFFTTPINATTRTQYNFYKCGFTNQPTEKTTISKDIFINDYTQIENSIPIVQSITRDDLYKMFDPTGNTPISQGINISSNDLLAIPCKQPQNKNYARTWLATKGGGMLNNVSHYGGIDTYEKEVFGVRVVVSLKSDARFSLAEECNSTDTVKIWNLEY